MKLYQKFKTDYYDIKSESVNLKCKGSLIILRVQNYTDGHMINSVEKYVFNSGKDLHDYIVNCEIPHLKENCSIDEFDLEVLDYIVEKTLTNPGAFCLHYNWGYHNSIRAVLTADYIRVLTGEDDK